MAARKSAKKARKKKAPKKARAPKALRTHKGSSPGRPEIEFPEDCVEMIHLLVGAGLPLADVATLADISKSTLERRAAEVGHPVQVAVSTGMAMRHSALRVAQFQSALGGNAVMLKFLGFNELGQQSEYQRSDPGGGEGAGESAAGDYADLMLAKILEAQRSERTVDIDLPAGPS